MEAKLKLWVEKNNEVVFGEGRLLLLNEIEKCGSISKAAKALSMSYRAAWGKIRASEDRLEKKLVDVKKGGVEGGGSSLTPYAKKLIRDYTDFKKEVKDFTQAGFKKKFL